MASPALRSPQVKTLTLTPVEEQQSVATPQASRVWARSPCRRVKIQSCVRLGSAFDVAAFQERCWGHVRAQVLDLQQRRWFSPVTHDTLCPGPRAFHCAVTIGIQRGKSCES